MAEKQNKALEKRISELIDIVFENPREAIPELDKLIESHPNDAALYRWKGYALNELRRRDEAILEYDTAIRLEPDHAITYQWKGRSLSELNRDEEAIIEYDMAISLNPNDAFAHAWKGFSLNLLNKKTEAHQALDIAIDLAVDIKSFSLCATICRMKSRWLTSWKENSWAEEIEVLNKKYRKATQSDLPFYHGYKELLSNEDDRKKPLYQKLWKCQYELLSLLRVDLNDPKIESVAHYTSVDVLNKLIGNSLKAETSTGSLLKDFEAPSKLKMCNVSSANDSIEGRAFNKFLGQADSNENEKMLVLQTSFSARINHLTQYRLYGKSKNQEGTGLCIALKKDFFAPYESEHSVSMSKWVNESLEDSSEKTDSKKIEPDKREILYWVLYYNSEGNYFLHTPEQITVRHVYSEKKFKKEQKKLNANGAAIAAKLHEIKKVFDELKTPAEKSTALEMLIYLRHLVKDISFADEREMRILRLCDYKSKDLEFLPNGTIASNYLSLMDNCDCVEKIILGPEVKNHKEKLDRIKRVIAMRAEAAKRPCSIEYSKCEAPFVVQAK